MVLMSHARTEAGGELRAVTALVIPVHASALPRGFEPRTLELTALCSAAELRENKPSNNTTC